MSCQIRNLENLIKEFLPKSYTLLDAKLCKLTSSGDNYGSVLLAVDLLVEDDYHEAKHIYAVAKKLPQNPLVQKMFNSQITFPNEVGFYQVIVPQMRNFQKQHQIPTLLSSFPKFYAARVGQLEDSVLLIKNIKHEGFRILDRTIGFNFEQAKLILFKMSELHATFRAFFLQKRRSFDEIAYLFAEYHTFEMNEENNKKMIEAALQVVRDDRFCIEKLQEILVRSSELISIKNDRRIEENHFFSIVHSDMWTNNIMVKLENEEIQDVKFVDFQLYELTSLTRDVAFFIYTSVQTAVLEEKCDFLFYYYYENFVSWLKKLDCKIDDYSYASFLQELQANLYKFEFFHIMTMLPPIYATSKDTKDVEQLEMDNFIFYGSEITSNYREKATFIVNDLLKRGWLQ